MLFKPHNAARGTVWPKLVFAGELFAQAPVSQYPGSVVEAVTDSSRYFVIRIEDGNGKARLANVGCHICFNASSRSKPMAGSVPQSGPHGNAHSICGIYPAGV